MLSLKEFLTNDFKPLDVNQTIEKASILHEQFQMEHIPILEDGMYIGMLSTEDLYSFNDESKISEYKYTLGRFFVRNNAAWLDVLEVFAQNQTDILPVLDEKNQYVGCYRLLDVIGFFNDTPFLKEKGNVMIVQKSFHDYSMSQVTQIVESNNGKLLGLFISFADTEIVQITLKTTLGSTNDIIQTFRRYGYEIVSNHEDDAYITNLKERSEYLNRYLNI
jgi:Mg/Co/Ni transporter MgtE